MATRSHAGGRDVSAATGVRENRRPVDWPTVMTSAALALVPFVAILVSLFILQGQTNARIDATNTRIDSTRTELAGKIDSTNARIDDTNARIDRVLEALAGIGKVADDIEALRADVAKLVPSK